METEIENNLISSVINRSLLGPTQPRVFILSNIRLVREGLTLVLSHQSSIEVVGSSDVTILDEIADLCPDVLLLDVSCPAILESSILIRRAMPDVKIVALGVAEVEQVVMACAKAGICGFVYSQGSVNDVVTAVHSAVRGELLCSPRTAGMLLNRINGLDGEADYVSGEALTPREQEIMSFVNEGLSNKQIAIRLGIRDTTVKNHVHSILGKLRVRRRGEAAARLRQHRPRADAYPARQSGQCQPDRPGIGPDRSA
ncbi:MAG TPA: response regulator transcription factor [Phycisphaerae bacterium]|nr:response regulator transcription factor [Phycisphaerae bacterium]